MASTIQIKNSTTSGNSPSSLTTGELAINVADGNLFYGDGSSVLQRFAITELTASSNVDIQGTLSLPGFTDVSASLAAAVAGGDNLGNHTATQDLDLDDNSIKDVLHITASGNISSSNTTHTKFLRLPQTAGDISEGAIYFGSGVADNNGYIYDDGNNLQIGYNDSDILQVNDSTPQVSITGDLKVLGGGAGTITTTGKISGSSMESSGDIHLSTNNTQISQVLSGGATRDLIGFDGDNNAVIGNPTANKIKLVGDVTASGDISASGDLSIQDFTSVSASLATIPTNNNQLTNGAGYTTNTGTVTSVGGTGTVSGLSLSGTVTTSGNLTLGGTISLVAGDIPTITSAKISDVDAFSQSGTYASLRAQGTTAGDVGLGNVTNESKATMFSSPTFTGTVSGVTKTHVGLGNVENTALSTYTGNGGALDNQYITNGAGYTTNTGTVTSVATGNGLTGGTITSTGTLSVDYAGSTNIITSAPNDGSSFDSSDKIIRYSDGDEEVQDTTIANFKSGYNLVDTSGTPADNQIAIFTDSNTVEGTSELTYNGTTLNIDGQVDIDEARSSGAVVDINNTYSGIMGSTHYALKVTGGQANGTPGSAIKAYGGHFTAGNTNGTNPDTIALYAQGHEDGAPNSYAAIFSGSAGGVVGINTMEPTVELDVVGDISASNNIVAGGDMSIDGFPSVSASLAAASGGGGSNTVRFAVNGGCFLGQTAQRAMPFGSSTSESTLFSYVTTYMIPADCKLVRVNTCCQSNAGDVTLKAYKIPDSTADNTAISNGTLLQTVTVQDHDAGDPFEFTFGSTGTITKGSKFGLTVESDTNPNGFRFTAYFEEV